MLSVLIVDDDEEIRLGLKNTIQWQSMSIKDVYLAGNGLEATKILAEREVHMLISDVEMPIMNGIQLSAHVHKEYPHIQMLMLSAHSTFEYAKLAMQYGVNNYLLKPVCIGELVSELKAMKKRIVSNKSRHIQDQKAKEYTKILMSSYLERLVNGEALEAEKIQEIREFYHLQGHNYFYVLVKVSGINELDVLEQTEYVEYEALTEGYLLFYSEEMTQKKVYEFLLNLHLDTAIGVRISERLPSIVNLNDGKRQLDSLRQELFWGNEHILVFKKYAVKRKTISTQKLATKILKEISHGQRIKDKDIDRFVILAKEEDIAPEQVKELAQILIHMIVEYCLTRGIYEELSPRIAKANEEIEGAFKINQVVDVLKELIGDMSNRLGMEKASSKHRIVKEMKAYIANHYSENIDVALLSEMIKRSPNYLSHLFSSLCKETISEYINGVRIQQAKILLVETDHTLYRISKEVGYKDDKYFIKIFKKLNGMTPSQYRNILNSNF